MRTITTGGDSLLLGMIPPLQRALELSGYDFQARWFTGFLDADADGRWSDLLATSPDVLILFFAPWEMATLRQGSPLDLRDPDWIERYVQDFVEPRVAQLGQRGIETVWIGLPPPRDALDAMQYAFLDSFWRDLAERQPTITWLDGATLLAGPDGRYLEVDDSVSPPVRLYQPDGRHLCPEGGRRLAAGLLDLLRERYGVEVDPGWVATAWADNPVVYGVGVCPAPT